ncbi:MAG TPA: glycosyltransferase [Geminicoccaceae bacterium]|nr:glycosyltransferase [Geminicoccus sp.]HMU48905.1 glycosyltransferase [Geminicoccaceae bacterium]
MDIETGAPTKLEFKPSTGADRMRNARPRSIGRHLSFLIADLNVGGVQKTTLSLAGAMAARGNTVDLLVLKPGGTLSDQVPEGVEVVELRRSIGMASRLYALLADPAALPLLVRPVLLPKRASQTLPYLPALVRYLRGARPDALLSATPHLNLEAIWARRLAGVQTRLLVSERSAPSQKLPVSKNWRHRHLPPLIRRTYPMADVIVSVSQALGDDLSAVTGLPRDIVRTIYNPVVGADIERKARAKVEHPWLQPGQPPVILGVGRLTDQKDFPTLLRAFARVRAQRDARLVILGGAKDEEKSAERQALLQRMAGDLGVAADVDLPGFVKNPYAFLARASLFVLSSRFEGLPGAMIQALACGCPVVSTDCPTGPAEILDNGRYGPLVRMGDDRAMAEAIVQTLDAPPPAAMLQRRAADFGEDRAVEDYLDALFGQPVPTLVRESVRPVPA